MIRKQNEQDIYCITREIFWPSALTTPSLGKKKTLVTKKQNRQVTLLLREISYKFPLPLVTHAFNEPKTRHRTQKAKTNTHTKKHPTQRLMSERDRRLAKCPQSPQNLRCNATIQDNNQQQVILKKNTQKTGYS